MQNLEDEVTVLSEETITTRYAYEPRMSGKRQPYVPPRALAKIEEEEGPEEINKGCYYFMACVDTFWIL